jgi:16S rRNA (guanine527-N7)-methyltransferase
MELILSYFPDLPPAQVKQLEAVEALYVDWNQKINVISRKDIDQLYLHHVLHSLVLAKYGALESGMKVLDLGTGGGFPGIPLAILFPEIQFTLLDGTAKKIRVVSEVTTAIGLQNVTAIHARVEDHQDPYDLITTRAVSDLAQTVKWSAHLMSSPRWLMLKGGDPKEFRKELPPVYKVISTPVSQYFKEEYFEGKYIVDVQKK